MRLNFLNSIKNKEINFPVPLFLLFNFIFLFGISVSRSDFFYEHIENFDQPNVSLTLLIFIFILFGYGLLFFKGKEELNKNSIACFILIVVFSFITPPFLSRDVGAYLLGAKNIVWFHVNPYLVSLDSISANGWIRELGDVWWLKYPYPYGPLFLVIASIAVLPNFAHLISAVYSYKFIVFIAYLISVWIFSKIVKELSLHKFSVILYALNPAILVNGVAEGHNEIFIILFMLLSVYFILKGNNYKSYFSWIAAAFIKYSVFIFLPIFWKKYNKFLTKNIFASISGIIIFFALFVIIFFSQNPRDFVNNILIMKGQLGVCLYRCSPVVSVADILAGGLSDVLRLALFCLLYTFFFFKFLVQNDNFIKFLFWSFLSLIFVLTRWVSPWYVLVIIPIGLLIDDKKYQTMVFFLTTYSLVHFFGIF